MGDVDKNSCHTMVNRCFVLCDIFTVSFRIEDFTLWPVYFQKRKCGHFVLCCYIWWTLSGAINSVISPWPSIVTPKKNQDNIIPCGPRSSLCVPSTTQWYRRTVLVISVISCNNLTTGQYYSWLLWPSTQALSEFVLLWQVRRLPQ